MQIKEANQGILSLLINQFVIFWMNFFFFFRINEPLNVASIHEVDHTTIHPTSPNIASKVPPPHLIIPHSNGYSDDQYSYCINAENDSELSHCRFIV